MMDYEKKYNDALERAKSFQEKYGGDYAGYIFPELAESEDERIRKEIIDFIQWAEDRGMTRHDYHQAKRPAEWIAYLEKQKEQKPWKVGENAHFTPDKETPIAEQKPAEIAPNQFDGITYGMQWYSTEKPAEWSEEDNIGWDEAFACVTRAEKAAKNEEELQNAVTAEKWLKEIKFKYCVHPVKQEWSEEDEEMLEYIIGDVNDAKQLYTTKEAKDMADKEIAWLKSLRPSWKPSEEHLSALLAIFNDPNNIGSQTCQLALTDLYEQLKRLM